MKPDRIYYWVGGTERGQWREATIEPYYEGAWTNPEKPLPGEKQIDASIRRINRMGYVTRKGHSNIGPPDTPPDAEELRAMWGQK